ncbi:MULTISPECIES: HD domain-containing protein [unclassified Bacillus (in: firmicutes)]|uniref:HD domain-containing protein n=1 Tax=unclassified Bacillus (in: firmicutes) TaxID=185979 RepID=UPI002282249F|nr:HD domain-containing protein [Bacillus sp. S20C3]MCY8203217.1 HD domain-containing protein [Bacillus sp. N12A5]MCY8289071.1 HD domain-containing protein [Bacillus sp. N13C7]MCY8638941.1 HD domain-containing protein [Bacillus sp. S17B2]MCY8720624.1 HD domain-containing protein [Bacillus sp. S10C12M]MCY9143942.1 HD domain-containing protein [Bacillus sp. T9C1]
MKELKQIRAWVKTVLTGESSGHDWHHVSRVADLALYIGKQENADLVIVETAALVHDLIDVKLPDTVRLSVREVYDQLVFFGVGREAADRVIDIITRMSFRDREKLAEEPFSIEGKAVQDADRLDAIGAVGIARAFMFAGAKGHGLYGDEQSAYAHFFHKLLRLKDMMNTDTARELAEERHDFMLHFVRQLEKDIPGIDAETS